MLFLARSQEKIISVGEAGDAFSFTLHLIFLCLVQLLQNIFNINKSAWSTISLTIASMHLTYVKKNVTYQSKIQEFGICD